MCVVMFLLLSAPVIKLMSLHDELKALKDQISLSEDKDLTSGEGQKSHIYTIPQCLFY